MYMKYIISGRNIDVTDGLKEMIYEKIGKLEKFFHDDTTANVTLSVEKSRQKVEVTIPVKGSIIRAEQTSDDMYVSIDLVEEIIERQIRKYRTKLKKSVSASGFNPVFMEAEAEEKEAVQRMPVVKTKRFAIKPMDVEEACVQMELLNHNFFVFRNSEMWSIRERVIPTAL